MAAPPVVRHERGFRAADPRRDDLHAPTTFGWDACGVRHERSAAFRVGGRVPALCRRTGRRIPTLLATTREPSTYPVAPRGDRLRRRLGRDRSNTVRSERRRPLEAVFRSRRLLIILARASTPRA